MDELDTEDKLRKWISLKIENYSEYLVPTCRIERLGDAWVVSPPLGNIGMSVLIIAADGMSAKAQITAKPLISLERDILSGAWKKNEDLSLVYPEPAQLPFHEDPLFQDSSWMQKLAEMERESLD